MKIDKTQKKITNKWLIVPLCSLGEIVTGNTPPTKNLSNYTGSHCWATAEDFKSKYIFDTKIKLSDSGKKYSRFLPEGSVLVTCIASIGKNAIAKVPLATNQQINAIIVNSKNNNEFVYYWIQNSVPLLKRIAGAGAMQILNKNEFSKLKILIPPLPEQNRIVSVLETWDKAIEKLTKKIDLKKNIKKGLMRRLLTGELRLSGFSDKWQSVRLGDICEIKKGQGLSREKLSNDGKNKCILYGELYTKYNDIIYNVLSRTDVNEGVKSIAGDILIPASTTTNALDLAIAICLNEEGVLLGGDINILRQKKKYNSDFLALYLTHIKKHSLARLAQGITIVHLYGKDCKKIQLLMPSIKEQSMIAGIIIDSEKEKAVLEKKLAIIKEQKNYLLNNLITGAIRTPETMKIKS